MLVDLPPERIGHRLDSVEAGSDGAPRLVPLDLLLLPPQATHQILLPRPSGDPGADQRPSHHGTELAARPYWQICSRPGHPQLGQAAVVARPTRIGGSPIVLRAAVEPCAGVPHPDPMVVHLPRASRDRTGSPLLELDGDVFDRPLRSVARDALRQGFTDGQLEDLLNRAVGTYDDIVAFLRQSEERDGASSGLRSTACGQAGGEPWPDPGAILGPIATPLPGNS